MEQEEYRKAVEAAENLQKQLFERHKKYDVNTTFLPRLDGLPPQHTAGGSGGGGGNGRRGPKDGANPPGRVVKSLASEIEQLEESSAHFPEEPVLRSRSAKQAVRFKAGPAATKASGGGGGGASAGVAAPQVLSARRADSLPAVGIKYQQQQQPPALR